MKWRAAPEVWFILFLLAIFGSFLIYSIGVENAWWSAYQPPQVQQQEQSQQGDH
jgi:hypothetical protein